MSRQIHDRPHALYVAWGFPPSRGGGVYRALASANGLVEAGFDVTVLTCEREAFERFTGVDPSLEAAVHPAIEVVRLPFDWPAKEVDIRRWPEARAQQPVAWLLRRQEEDRRDFPETSYGHWAKPLEEAALAIHAQRPVDLVIGTANPNVDLVPALVLHERFGVPFVYDHRDTWTLDMYNECEANTDDPRVAEIELRLVSDSVETWFVNEPIADWHRQRYPEHAEKILAVPNGFDPDFSPLPAPRRAAQENGPVRFGYIGTMTPYMPMQEFVDAWAIAADRLAPGEAAADFYGYLGFYGTPHRGLSALFADADESGARYLGPLPKGQVRDVYAGFDVLLLIIGSGRYLTSGKVYEYMASGLPIVSVHDPSIDASRVLADYPGWFPAASLEPADIADALVAAAEAVRQATLPSLEAATSHAQAYERSRILGPRFDRLFTLITGKD
ncbi:glycosyl transferase [Nocardioides dubius]|uniref:Uncharacterized protein n=1 Tax=Nocardioides dubius TaxID=317019 RepID=A0ABN1TSV2_9ACTN